jgi:hypothetical protein
MERQPKKLSLYKALNIGYLRNEAKQKQRLKAFGYVLVGDLTTREHVIAFNPVNHKLLYISNGTEPANPTDIQNDVLGLVGGQRLSARREAEKAALNAAKQRFNPSSTTLVAHSLGAQYTNYIASPEDQVVQFNPYLTPGNRPRDNVHNYRTQADVVSAFAPRTSTTIVPGPTNPLTAHALANIRSEPIFV